MSRRKRLLGLKQLEEGNNLIDQGVPVTRVHKQLKLPWSYQSTVDIFIADRKELHSVTRPEWLKPIDEEAPILQEPPEDWKFEGTFPYGDWIHTPIVVKE